ncbi:probable methyltransferase At1g27930 [Amaranthus tricolor]|uniref:probable methyltransferase At1g27930 n=1 Tax=Amaranthus tricolor TaxID=29722 RepID=UPI0025911EB1|nr:probable methyltransferase At1g27930 [Amaranthus tricolor]
MKSQDDVVGSQTDKPRLMVVAFISFITGAFLMSAFLTVGRRDWPSYLISFPGHPMDQAKHKPISTTTTISVQSPTTPIQLQAILHYATSKITPQQNLQEITLSFNVLRSLSPCNFLVFGLGYDSLMWASLNPGGRTLFLEETPEWVKTVLKDAPYLNAKTVPYRTHLKEADELLTGYRDEPDCLPGRAFLKGNRKCRLALENLPEEVYEREWDVIMIDAPRGYFPEAPGRMAAIFSAAVMARGRKRVGNTHVFLHDVDRKVEKEFANEFLCMKYKVESAGRLWHFEIPPNNSSSTNFC